jgi:hypothetical protein
MLISGDRHDIFSLECICLTDILEHEVKLDEREV